MDLLLDKIIPLLFLAGQVDSFRDLMALSGVCKNFRKKLDLRKIQILHVVNSLDQPRTFRPWGIQAEFPIFCCHIVTIRRFTGLRQLILNEVDIRKMRCRKVEKVVKQLSNTVTELEFRNVRTTGLQWNTIVPVFLSMRKLIKLHLEGSGSFRLAPVHINAIRSRKISQLKLQIPVQAGIFILLCQKLHKSLRSLTLDLFNVIWDQQNSDEIAAGLGLLTNLESLTLMYFTDGSITNHLTSIANLKRLVLITEPNRCRVGFLGQLARLIQDKIPSTVETIVLSPFDLPMVQVESGQTLIDRPNLIRSTFCITGRVAKPLHLVLGIENPEYQFSELLVKDGLLLSAVLKCDLFSDSLH